ncbi:MAG TPA: hypothetical protein VFM45_09610 [Anaeromyxobacteraceae bacterium]|nr:hypothetical protein [Anaeromyxobacteraceae bacterium]
MAAPARNPGWPGRLAAALPVVASVAWPFVVVVGSRVVGTRATAALLLLLVLPGAVRGLRGDRGAGRRSLWLAGGAALLAAAAAVLGDGGVLLAWPVLVSLALLVAFLSSLRGGRSIVEGFARLQKPDLSAAEVAYCRTVTWVWCAFFVANGATAAALALSGRRELWAVYTGVVSYLLMGLLFAGEYLVRRRKFPAIRGAA